MGNSRYSFMEQTVMRVLKSRRVLTCGWDFHSYSIKSKSTKLYHFKNYISEQHMKMRQTRIETDYFDLMKAIDYFSATI